MTLWSKVLKHSLKLILTIYQFSLLVVVLDGRSGFISRIIYPNWLCSLNNSASLSNHSRNPLEEIFHHYAQPHCICNIYFCIKYKYKAIFCHGTSLKKKTSGPVGTRTCVAGHSLYALDHHASWGCIVDWDLTGSSPHGGRWFFSMTFHDKIYCYKYIWSIYNLRHSSIDYIYLCI